MKFLIIFVKISTWNFYLLFDCLIVNICKINQTLFVTLFQQQNNLLVPMLTSSASVQESDASEKASISSIKKKQPKKEYKNAHELGLYQ